MAEFIPSYLEIDFLTLVEKFREELKDSDIYRDYDFEGANISILIELMSYIGELTTFFTNKIAKNVRKESIKNAKSETVKNAKKKLIKKLIKNRCEIIDFQQYKEMKKDDSFYIVLKKK